MKNDETLWTVIIDTETGKIVDVFDQSIPGCGMGPDTCGGCCDCMIAQAGESCTIRYDVSTGDMEKMARRGHEEGEK